MYVYTCVVCVCVCVCALGANGPQCDAARPCDATERRPLPYCEDVHLSVATTLVVAPRVCTQLCAQFEPPDLCDLFNEVRVEIRFQKIRFAKTG